MPEWQRVPKIAVYGGYGSLQIWNCSCQPCMVEMLPLQPYSSTTSYSFKPSDEVLDPLIFAPRQHELVVFNIDGPVIVTEIMPRSLQLILTGYMGMAQNFSKKMMVLSRIKIMFSLRYSKDHRSAELCPLVPPPSAPVDLPPRHRWGRRWGPHRGSKITNHAMQWSYINTSIFM